CGTTIVWWRQSLGVNRTNSQGSRRLIRAAAELGGAAFKERGITEEERQRFRQLALELDLGRYLRLVPAGGLPLWTPEELSLLGTKPDAVIARKIGRTLYAVRSKRLKEGISRY